MAATDRTFALPNTTYGFIGIGVMGWGMAQNLRRKMPKSSALIICELNKPRRDKFIAETEGLVKVGESPKEIAEQAVGHLNSIFVYPILTKSRM
jgi:3-hydroxyisobutyrate/3-hydroxypropionate dehydrogenase